MLCLAWLTGPLKSAAMAKLHGVLGLLFEQSEHIFPCRLLLRGAYTHTLHLKWNKAKNKQVIVGPHPENFQIASVKLGCPQLWRDLWLSFSFRLWHTLSGTEPLGVLKSKLFKTFPPRHFSTPHVNMMWVISSCFLLGLPRMAKAVPDMRFYSWPQVNKTGK